MNILPILFALAAGFFTAIEQSINGRLGKEITPSIATLHNLMTGAALMLLINLVRGNLPRYLKIESLNPLLLIGGIFGAMIIYLSAKAIPALGVTTTLTLVIAGQLTCGLITDMFFSGLEIGATKWIGIALVLLGSYLMVK